MKRPLYLVKIGGSILTNKARENSDFNVNPLRTILKEIIFAKGKKEFSLILIHGAGAYPHFLSTKFNLKAGYSGSKSSQGFSKVKNELLKLSSFFIDECISAGLNASFVEPSAAIITKAGEVTSFDMRFIEALLKMNVVPVLSGDDVIDLKQGIAILSGDKTLAYLAQKLKAQKALFATDVDGIFDKNPKIFKDAVLIKEINKRNFNEVLSRIEIGNKYDASGEMKGKLLSIKQALSGFEVTIFNGSKEGNFKKALLGNSIGTRISL